MKNVVILLITFILLSFSVFAQAPDAYHLKLLAVQEIEGEYQGSDADLFLELREGSGRVFLETVPLTKLDTQISTRFAKDIACNHFKLDCNKHDFIFTIKAKSSIIGGPSAGAAIAALTTIAVLDLEYNKDITITGTINSGGVIGPVGGVKGKLDAASRAGLKKVLVSQGAASDEMNESNFSGDLGLYAKNTLNLELQEVVDLDEVLLELTGINFNGKEYNITENKEYAKIMQKLQVSLCDRNQKLLEEIKDENIELNNSILEDVYRNQERSVNATKLGDYYSAASFCFGNNIQLKREFYLNKNINNDAYERLFELLNQKLITLERDLKFEKIETISDLQTYMVVTERLTDSKERIKLRNATEDYDPNILAYAEERYYSAVSWKQFFAMDGKKYNLNKELIRNSCSNKISEAEERHQYAALFIGEIHLFRIKDKILLAQKALQNGESELCLITAAQAKADANAVLGTLGVDEENLDKFIESKRKAVQRVIFENSQENTFPILGYSYYQYANSLAEQDKYTALVYLEYALEMSDLGIYFPEENKFLTIDEFALDEKWNYLLIGLIIGMVFMWFVRKKN